jgi:hypothetical protein
LNAAPSPYPCLVHPRRVFTLAFAAFFLISAAWALAMPVNGTYDEKHHIVRAYAVAAGHWLPDGPASDGTTFGTEGFDVPASLLPGNVDCAVGAKRRGPASCQAPVASRQKVRTPSAAARYSPVYYLPVGLPLLASPDQAGILLARLVSALMSALLLAGAVATAVRLRSRLLVAGVALVATPMVTNLNGSLNPNGLEISAGVLLFTTLCALLRGVVTRRLIVGTGIAAALMLTVRALGPVLLAVDVAACLLVAGGARTLTLWRDRAARLILAGFVLAGVAFVAVWTFASRGPDVAPVAARAVGGNIPKQIATDRVPFYVNQVVGQFGYGETTISQYAIVFWYLLAGAVVIPALIWSGWRLRLVLGALGAFCLAMLVAMDLYFAPLNGWFAHGRYALPTAVGLVLLAAPAWPTAGMPARLAAVARSRWFAIGLVAATTPVHLYALARVMTRFQTGIDAPLNPFTGSWRPMGGPSVPLLVAVLGLVALLMLVFTTERYASTPAVTMDAASDNGTVTPIGQTASDVTKASTSDVASH